MATIIGRRTPSAEAAYRAFCEEHKRAPDDREKFAFLMGWYDGRIALHNDNMRDSGELVSLLKKQAE